MCCKMSSKILLFVYFVGMSQAVFVDPHNDFSTTTLSDEDNNNNWKVVKMYHPPSSHFKIEQHAYPKYEFAYAVSDKNTGDHKHHHESRDGDRVHGEYSLVEPDGSLRKVEYNADDHNGFKAVVSKGIHKHGANAVSLFGHTRHFYPIGHGIKINHYFPGKDHSIDKASDTVIQKEGKPVQEPEQDLSNNSKEEPKTTPLETENKVVQAEQGNIMKAVEELQTPLVKGELTKDVTVTIVPAVVTIMPNVGANKETGAVLKNDKLPEDSPTDEKQQENENPKTKIADSYHDSETASSYSHSRFYYAF